jgi:hypothetical protein
MLKNDVLVGTHHKTGTVWMAQVFQRFCRLHGVVFVDISEKSPEDMVQAILLNTSPCVVFSHHSEFPDFSQPALAARAVRGIHVVRDPRDLLLSAARYHCDADEPQLLVPRPEFGGMTYREKISSLPTQDEQILFEMEHSGGRNIAAMCDFDDQGVFDTVKFEDLIEDETLVLWHGICLRLGLRGTALLHAIECFYHASLFSRRDPVRPQSPSSLAADALQRFKQATRPLRGRLLRRSVNHVRGGTARQWTSAISTATRERIEEEFGEAIRKLDYPLGSQAGPPPPERTQK